MTDLNEINKEFIFHLIDTTWNHAYQDKSVPSTIWASEILQEAITTYVPQQQEGIQRFKMPVDKQLLDMALIFNDGHLDPIKLADMVAMCQFILYRLHENGDINIPSSQEKE